MVSATKLIKNIINVKHSVIDDIQISKSSDGIVSIEVYLHPIKSYSDRCPHCGKRCPIYDRSKTYKKWRALDCGGIIVELYARTQRIDCETHGVVVASVPWAFHDSCFTKDFDLNAAYLAMNINKSVAAKYMRCDWKTIMRCISRTRDYLEPNIKERFNGLENIGIDETSYRKGHKYVTVVVNHDNKTVVWVGLGHSAQTLSEFFELLSEEQRSTIKTVSGDGAKWIDVCINKYIPNATRCVDGYHVVTWAMEGLDNVRKDIWHALNKDSRALQNANPRGRGRPTKEDEAVSKQIAKAKNDAKLVKGSSFTIGKAPENLTPKQEAQLEYLALTHKQLFRAYKLKEQLRLALKFTNIDDAKAELDSFFWRATHSRISYFKELAYKIRRHEKNILNTIKTGLSNARVESVNNKIKLFFRKAYGFRNTQNMIDMIMLGCSNIFIPLPNRGGSGLKVA